MRKYNYQIVKGTLKAPFLFGKRLIYEISQNFLFFPYIYKRKSGPMSFEDQTTRIETLIWLINSNKTGTAQVLARTLGVSRRTVFNDIDFLKGKGYPIFYCHSADSYRFGIKEKNFFLF